MIGKDLVPSAIDEYIIENQKNLKLYWNKKEYLKLLNESDLIHLGEIYLRLRGKGKDLVEIGKRLYRKGEEKHLPGFDRKFDKNNT